MEHLTQFTLGLCSKTGVKSYNFTKTKWGQVTADRNYYKLRSIGIRFIIQGHVRSPRTNCVSSIQVDSCQDEFQISKKD